MTKPVQMGINVDFFVSYEDNITITEEEMDQFLDEFIELVEKHNWICGGGVTLQGANE